MIISIEINDLRASHRHRIHYRPWYDLLRLDELQRRGILLTAYATTDFINFVIVYIVFINIVRGIALGHFFSPADVFSLGNRSTSEDSLKFINRTPSQSDFMDNVQSLLKVIDLNQICNGKKWMDIAGLLCKIGK